MADHSHIVGERMIAARPEAKVRVETAERLCFFSHFDVEAIVDDYVLHYLRHLADAGFVVVFVTTCALDPVQKAKLDGLCAEIVERPNIGADFGGWIDCWRRYPNIKPDLLLLCNDSVYGPFWSLRAFIDDLTSRPADFYGAVLSLNPIPHLQSWFLLFTPAAYQSAPFRELMGETIGASKSKTQIIEEYEERFTEKMTAAGLNFRAAFDPRRAGPVLARHPVNPAISLWRELLTARAVPFLKIGLLRERPLSVTGLEKWQAVTSAIDPETTRLAQANLQRRLARYRPPPLRRLRELMRLPTLPLAHLPIVKPILEREIRRPGVGGNFNRTYEWLNVLYMTVRWPYAKLYHWAGTERRRPRKR